jgi:hypothetical protein
MCAFLQITRTCINGLVVEYIVAIDVTRVRFPADAFFPVGKYLRTPLFVDVSLALFDTAGRGIKKSRAASGHEVKKTKRHQQKLDPAWPGSSGFFGFSCDGFLKTFLFWTGCFFALCGCLFAVVPKTMLFFPVGCFSRCEVVFSRW